MSILYLQEHIPHLNEIVNARLNFNETERYGYGASKFKDGIFLDKGNQFKGILGDDSTVDFTIKFYPDSNHLERGEEDFLFTYPLSLIQESSHQFTESKEGLIAKINLSADEYVQIRIRQDIQLNHPTRENYDTFHQDKKTSSKKPEISTYIGLTNALTEAGITLNPYASINERRTVQKSQIIHFVDLIKNHITYEAIPVEKGPGDAEDSWKLGIGQCGEMSYILSMMIHLAGGMAFTQELGAANLPYKGIPYFSADEFSAGHAVVHANIDEIWQFVEPTAYNTTSKDNRFPPGSEMRFLEEDIKHYFWIYKKVKNQKNPWPRGYIIRERPEFICDDNRTLNQKLRDKHQWSLTRPPLIGEREAFERSAYVDLDSIKVIK